jgi:hypothetical protein
VKEKEITAGKKKKTAGICGLFCKAAAFNVSASKHEFDSV